MNYLGKKLFKKAGAPVVEGKILKAKEDITEAIDEFGFPIVAKPDNGVGSAATYKINSMEEAKQFEEEWDASVTYFAEPYIEDGILCTYDGFVDGNGEIQFQTSFFYIEPTLETLKEKKDLAYTIQRKIDPKLEKYGRAIVKAFGMKERFFHIEFFHLPNGEYVTLEYNNRLAGGYTIDMYNFAYSMDLFEQYARVVIGEPFYPVGEDNQYCVGVMQRDIYNYAHYEKEISEKFGDKLKFSKRMPRAFAELQGDHFYAITADTKEEADEIIRFVHEKQN